MHQPYNLIIVCPTWSCNLACWYCYQEHTRERMAPEMVAGTRTFLTANAQRTDWTWLEFFGGEPLLYPDLLVDLARATRDACAEAQIPFFGGITTNAYLLTPAVLTQLLGAGVSHFQITLDGDPAHHDQQRRHASGRGTWDGIWNNLLYMHRSKFRFKVTLRVHFMVGHLEPTLRLLTDFINPTFAGDSRFAVQFEQIKPLGGPLDHQIPRGTLREVEAALGQLRAVASPEMLVDFTSANYSCYAGRPRTVVITPSGLAAKCTVSFEPIGHLSPEGHLDADPDRAAEWTRRASSCSSCPRSAAEPAPSPGLISLPLVG